MSMKNHKASLPTSPVLMGGSGEDLAHIREKFSAAINSQGIVDEIYVLDYAELTCEILRLRRWKTAMINRNFLPALQAVFQQLLLLSGYNFVEADTAAQDIAHRWFTNQQVKKYGMRLLRQHELDESAIEAEAFRKSADEIELLEKLVASAESRRAKIIREIAAYRNELTQQVENSANRIIEGEVLTHDGAAKNTVVEQAVVP
jgi:hypothetical protein